MGQVTNPATAAAGLKTEKPLQALLLGSVSLLACGIVLARAPAAFAQQVISSSTSGEVIANGENLFVEPNVYINATSHYTALINPTTVQLLSNSGTISGILLDIHNTGSIGTLSNLGLLDHGSVDGIDNQGSIGTLSNASTIIGGVYAVENQSTIATVTNSGLLYGIGGIENTNFNMGSVASTIGLLVNTNAGTIIGSETGIYNDASFIGTLSNAGNISGIINGINNTAGGTIGQLTNNFDGSISNITNAGLVGGAAPTAISNAGTITTLTNSGTISGTIGDGISNTGSISLLQNTLGGTISGAVNGIYNGTGNIGTLTNAGVITGIINNTSDGIENAGTISLLANEMGGTISGVSAGIYNAGNIGTLTNAGLVGGAADNGILNFSTITMLDNAGTGLITGDRGIDNQGNIATLTNAGTISAYNYGIFNNGTIGLLSNNATGTISGGSYGINNRLGTIGTLTNSGLIMANSYGINIFGGTIVTLTNTADGTITGTTGINNVDGANIGTLNNMGLISGEDGMVNDGVIGEFDNTGIIFGLFPGIYNTGLIQTLTNGGVIASGSDRNLAAIDNNFSGSISTLTNTANGTILGGSTAIANTGSATIGTITNSGLITGGEYGIYNLDSTIGELTNNTGGTISGGYAATYNDGAIATLTNAGLFAGSRGIYNDDGGTIGTLTNTGTIAATANPIQNDGFIGQLNNDGTIVNTNAGYAIFNGGGVIDELSNGLTGNAFIGAILNHSTIGQLINGASGTIAGGHTAIENDGLIGTLSNAGLIEGGNHYGVSNYGIITQLANQAGGTITGGSDAIQNNNGISTLTNSGLINGYTGINNASARDIGQLTNNNLIVGQQIGIENYGTITSLGNTGTISGNYAGIYDSGLIQTLTNSGLITGFDSGIENNGGTIVTLTNNATGTISASTAILSYGGNLGTLTNSGLIAGNVKVFEQDLNIIGGTGSIFGTLTGGIIAFYGDGNLNLLSGNEILTDGIYGTTGDGAPTLQIGTLTNSGVLQIGYPGEPATITVAGNYAQTPAGTLNVIVTPATSSEMTITGTANLAGGVDYIFAPGTYRPKTYSYLTAGSITGTFTSENYGAAPASDVSTTYESDPTADLVIGSGFSLPEVVNPSDSAIFSDQTEALAEATQASDASLLGMAETGGAAASPACEGQAAFNPGATNGNNANIASAIGAELCNHGGWIEADGALGHVSGTSGASAYNANTAGFLAGIDKLFGATRLGFAIGYDETYLSDKAGGSGDMGTTRVALYGAQPLGPILLSGVIGYGHAGNNTTRSTGIGGVKETNKLGIVSGALQASMAVSLSGFELIPAAGLRYANVEAASFTEAPGQNNAFALTGRTKNFNSVQPYATVELTTTYLTPSGYSVAPQATLGLQDEAGNRGAATALYAADGTPFASTRNIIDPLAAILGAGLSASKNNLTLYIDYNGLVAGNWNTQTGTAGLRVSF